MKHREPVRRNLVGASQEELSRRKLLSGAVAGAACAIVPRHVLGGPGHVPPSEKTVLAGIGMGGQGIQNITNFLKMPEVQVTAVCDVNREGGGYLSVNWNTCKEQRTGGREPARRAVDDFYAQQKPSGKYHGCRAYNDFRELLAKEQIDAVMIATPDHTHAVIAMAAIKLGKHVYCEKPLTHSVAEARQVAEAARRAGVATQLGNAGQASEEARFVQEYILDDAIGPVREIQVGIGPASGRIPHGAAARKRPRPCRLALIGTCGWDLLPSDRIIQPIVLGPGATGGISGRGWSATSAATCSRLPSKP